MQRDLLSIAIVGLGPRGINVLERITAHASYGANTPRLQLHLIDPGVPGAGIHHPGQPDYLLLNTVASQITMFMDPTIENAGPLIPGPSLYEWAVGIQNTEYHVGPNSYLPRRIFGEYLNWVFHYLVHRLQRYADVQLYPCEAIDLQRQSNGSFTISLSGGGSLNADYLFLTTGHAQNHPDHLDRERGDFVSAQHDRNRYLDYIVSSPYPINHQLRNVPLSASVAIEGMGLTAIDAVAALTVGRGGQFHRNPTTGELIYQPSGQEPALALYSRSGLPLSARADNQKGVSDQYRARFLTQDHVSRWRTEKKRGELDFFGDVFPLIERDMAHAYYLSYARQYHGAVFAALLDETLVRLDASSAKALLKRCCPEIPEFSWQSLAAPIPKKAHKNRETYQIWLRTFLEQDLVEARRGNVDSPLKAACDVLRDVRDNLRNAIDFGALSSESHRAFMSDFVPVMNRLAVGPPLERIEEWLALAKAGYLDLGFGPGAYSTLDPEQASFIVNSRLFPHATFRADVLVRAQVPKSSPAADQSVFIQHLLERGLIRPFCIDDVEIGGIEVDANLHIVSAKGEALDNAWALGTVCEGAKFYTYIVPRPYVGSTALVDANRTVGELFSKALLTPKSSEKPTANIAV